MKTILALAIAGAAIISSPSALAQTAKAATKAVPAAKADAPWPEAWFEVFKLAPGKQEEFIRIIAIGDQASAAAGLPPIQLYFHQDGADWDVLLFKPVPAVKPTAEQEAIMEAKSKELHIPSGPAYFVWIRELIASHTDSKATGPVSAAQWLAKLDQWRAENGKPAQ